MEGPQINPLQRGWRADPAVRRTLTSYVVSWMTKAAAIAGRGAGGPMHLAPSFAGTPRLTGADLMHVFLDVLLASRYDVCMHDAAMMALRRGCRGVLCAPAFLSASLGCSSGNATAVVSVVHGVGNECVARADQS